MIRISDDSSTESDAGLDSDFHSSPESVLDDDVVILDAVGLPADDRGEARSPAFAPLQMGETGSESCQGRAAAQRQNGFMPAVWGEGEHSGPLPLPCTGCAPTPRNPPPCPLLGAGLWAGVLVGTPDPLALQGPCAPCSGTHTAPASWSVSSG